MLNFTQQALLTTLVLGVAAYLLCLYLARREPRVELSTFLFIGNQPRDAAVSIVGTIFSGSVLFTGMVHFYRVFSWYLLPCYLLSAVLGLSLLKRRVKPILESSMPTPESELLPEHIRNRFMLLSSQTGCRLSLYLIYLLYLLFSLTAEISVFRGGLAVFDKSALIPFATLVLLAITYAYVFLGGFRGVLLTDVVQMATIVISFIAFFITIFITSSSQSRVHSLPSIENFTWYDVTCMGISAVFIGTSMWSSSPEVWIRVITLRGSSEAKSAIQWAFIGTIIVLLLPVLLVAYAAPTPAASIDLTEAFTVWTEVLSTAKIWILPYIFLLILINAIFTTIDTYILTFEQLLYIMRSEFAIFETALAGRLRLAAPIFIAVSFVASMRLDNRVLFLVGAMSISLPLVLFGLVHLSPFMKSNHGWVFWTPIVAGLSVLPITHALILKGRPVYYLVPLAVVVSQLLIFGAVVLYDIFKRPAVRLKKRGMV